MYEEHIVLIDDLCLFPSFVMQFTHFAYMGIGFAVGAIGFGLFGFALFPIALELGVECTYPVAEGTSAGLLQISGSVHNEHL